MISYKKIYVLWEDFMEEILKIYHTPEVCEKIRENIRANRCGDFEIELVDDLGKPLVGKEIEIKQIAHIFKFGANCFVVDELETEEKNKNQEITK